MEVRGNQRVIEAYLGKRESAEKHEPRAPREAPS